MADARRVPALTGARRSDVAVAVGVIAVVMMMIIPLPAFVLDALLAMNLVLSLLIILIVLYTRHALEFSVFPTLLLVATVFGLALNLEEETVGVMILGEYADIKEGDEVIIGKAAAGQTTATTGGPGRGPGGRDLVLLGA